MAKKPTYEELEQRVSELKKEVSKLKQTEEVLEQSEEKYRGLVENSFDGIFVQKGPTIIFTNQRLNEMLGYDESELIGLDHWLAYHPDYREVTRCTGPYARGKGNTPIRGQITAQRRIMVLWRDQCQSYKFRRRTRSTSLGPRHYGTEAG